MDNIHETTMWFTCAIVSDGIEYICVLHICPFADMVDLNILNSQLGPTLVTRRFWIEGGKLGPRVGGVMFLDQMRSVGTVGQFWPLGCRINSTLTFVIFCIRVDVLQCQ